MSSTKLLLRAKLESIPIDKRKDFSLEEWNQDNCGRSEHQWIGK